MRKVIDGVAKNLFTLFILVISLTIVSIGSYSKNMTSVFRKYSILTGYYGSNIQHHIKVERNNLK